MNVTNSYRENIRWKDWFICPFSKIPSSLWPLNFPRNCIFLEFYAGLSKKSKSLKAIYIYMNIKVSIALF